MANKKKNLKQMIALGSKTARGGFKNERGGLANKAPRKMATARPNQIILPLFTQIGE